MPIHRTKPWLVRLASFRIGNRPGWAARCVRTEILAVLDDLVGDDGIHDPARRGWAIQRALWRMVHRGRAGDPLLESVGPGRYRAYCS